MRTLLLVVAVLLAACSSITSPCGSIDFDCGPKTAGISSRKTIQLMLQSPMLIQGQPADPSEWPASVYAKVKNGACSATLIGDRVLFMAAHCMADGDRVNFSAHANQYSARCSHHPEYTKNDTADWALCLVDRPVIGVPFEVLAVVPHVVTGSNLLLSGYGCVKPSGGGGNDGIFRTGTASVKGTPYGKTYDIITKGGAALCFGDSGGAAYLVSEGTRVIVGVNSRGDIDTMSYLPAVYLDSFQKWAKDWAVKSNNVKLCGIHEDAVGCRTAAALDGKFEISSKAACIKGVVEKTLLDKKAEIVQSIKKAIENY